MIIKGTWEKGVLHGQAEVIHKNGDRFIGAFRDRRKHGFGRIMYFNGSTFEG